MKKKYQLNIESNLLTPEQVASKLGISLDTVYNYIKTRKIKAIKLSARNFRIDPKDLDAFIMKNKTK